jgi:hypothetical protein
VIVRDPAGAATILHVFVDTGRLPVDVDDLAISTSPNQPDTAITSGPPASTGARTATFGVTANQDKVTFGCTLDGVSAACGPFAGLALGAHTLTAAARDRWGLTDPTPAAYSWTVVPDADLDDVLDASDNCPAAANATQADVDADGIGDACDLFDPGTKPPLAGQSVRVKDVQGEVFVKLPGKASRLKQDPGFIPLKGVASLPVGATIDARKGRLAVVSAVNSRPAGDRRYSTQEAQVRAGIFRVRQQRLRRRASRRIPTSFVLVSGSGAEGVCTGGTRKRPRKAIVRSLLLQGRGFYRAIGGASVSSGRGGTWLTTDRCNGTLTEVTRGTVFVRGLRALRARKVRKGRAVLVRRALFLSIRGRPSP